MTMMSHVLLRLRGDEDWATCGERWYSHAQVVGHLAFVPDWSGPPAWLRDRPGRQLDWGAWMYEISLAEVRHLIGPRTNYADLREDWDRSFREAEAHQNALLALLPEDGRYAVVWMET
jgi:hypothetical protein